MSFMNLHATDTKNGLVAQQIAYSLIAINLVTSEPNTGMDKPRL